jgi:uncharacterized protein with GYD domain
LAIGYSESVSGSPGKARGKRRAMPAYVALINWINQGIRNVRDTLQRADRADQLGQKYGVRMEHLY